MNPMEAVLIAMSGYGLAAFMVLTVLGWVERGQPDPLHAHDWLPVARLRK